jgi:hypothetical protein
MAKVFNIEYAYEKDDECEDIYILVEDKDLEEFRNGVKNNSERIIEVIDRAYGGETDLEETPDFHMTIFEETDYSKFPWIDSSSLEYDDNGMVIFYTGVYSY